MNEKNFDYLDKQIKFTGFGEGHSAALREKMEKQTPEFTILHSQDYGKDNAVATLQFRKSTEGDMYFFNRYNLLLKNEHPTDPIRQTFYIHAKEDNITLKEGYNLMRGRAVHKDQWTREGEHYKAWLQLDFKATDKHGNYETKKFTTHYGFDLQQALAKHPIKELLNETDKERLVQSLERGNRQGVTLHIDGKEQKLQVEAAPQYKSLNFYDSDMKRINVQTLYEKQAESQTATQQQQEVKKEQQQKTGAADSENNPGRNNKRKGQKVQ